MLVTQNQFFLIAFSPGKYEKYAWHFFGTLEMVTFNVVIYCHPLIIVHNLTYFGAGVC
jgi:predicted acetyltransferase